MTAIAVDTRRGLEWQEDASCARDVYFTDRPFAEQVPVCRQCPVRFECLEYGIQQAPGNENSTVTYGGLSSRQLLKLVRERYWSGGIDTPPSRPRVVRKGPRSMVCVQCGGDFGAIRPQALYCSRTCRQNAYKANLQHRGQS